MIFILFILLAVFLFPYLLLPLSLFFGMLLLFLPFKFIFDSLFNLITVPTQIYKIATNPVLRKNHGLEHATINILEGEYGYQNLAGYAEENGFYILGVTNIRAVQEAALKGLKLLKNGQQELVIHKRCGTSLTVANFVSALIFLLLLFYTGHLSILNMALAILIANLMGPTLGQVVQKLFTTSSDVREMEITNIHFATGNNWGNWTNQGKVFIKTTQSLNPSPRVINIK